MSGEPMLKAVPGDLVRLRGGSIGMVVTETPAADKALPAGWVACMYEADGLVHNCRVPVAALVAVSSQPGPLPERPLVREVCVPVPLLDGGQAVFPRREFIPRWTEAEHVITTARGLVEGLGADLRLTDALVLLGAAQESVADYLEDVGADTRRLVQVRVDMKGAG